MPNKASLGGIRLLLLGLGLSALHLACAAQVVSLGQALKAPEAPQHGPQLHQPRFTRAPAAVHLSAIYGTSAALRVSIYLNGQRQERSQGDLLKAGATSCRLTRIDLPKRCVRLAQASAGGDLCPARACWTGEPAPAPQALPDASTPRSGRDLGMPPIPIPRPQPVTAQSRP